jgi:hypothetical protein
MLSLLALFLILGVVLIASSRIPLRGGHRLAVLVALTAALIGLVSLALASPRFGNRLAESEGYWRIAGRTFVLLSLTAGMPLGLTAAAVQAARRATSSRIVLAGVGVCAAIGGLALGIICMFAIWW